jgi:decaprenyl-phosphate phosphoribosyltransferase
MFKALLRSMRPYQWVKNIILFAALIFDRQLLNWQGLLRTLAGVVLFCLLSSAVYLMNDLLDVEADRQHPRKNTVRLLQANYRFQSLLLPLSY